MDIVKVIVLLLFPIAVLGGEDYKCIITNSVQPNTKGELYKYGDDSVIGKKFTVDRTSGVMSGVVKNNYVTSPHVIDSGSQENSFKVVTTMSNKRTSNVHVLTIQEFISGDKKPFIYLHDATVFYGLCTHF